ncbi:MAG: type IV pilin N-terminal domain-containing protein [Methanogenium sp.]
MKLINENEEAVSPVIGEMLMLSLVLILVSIFAVSASQFVPEDREPTVTIMVGGTDGSDHNVTFWHKGGDPIFIERLTVIFSKDSSRFVEKGDNITIKNDPLRKTFLPGDSIIVETSEDVSGWDVQMVTSKSVIFFGRIGSNE